MKTITKEINDILGVEVNFININNHFSLNPEYFGLENTSVFDIHVLKGAIEQLDQGSKEKVTKLLDKYKYELNQMNMKYKSLLTIIKPTLLYRLMCKYTLEDLCNCNPKT